MGNAAASDVFQMELTVRAEAERIRVTWRVEHDRSTTPEVQRYAATQLERADLLDKVGDILEMIQTDVDGFRVILRVARDHPDMFRRLVGEGRKVFA